MTTQHSVNDPPLSKIGVNVEPRFVVFHRPPNAAATYQVLGFFGSIATSCTRPVWMTGPMLRKARPSSALAARPSAAGAGAGAWRAPIATVAASENAARPAARVRV